MVFATECVLGTLACPSGDSRRLEILQHHHKQNHYSLQNENIVISYPSALFQIIEIIIEKNCTIPKVL